MRLNNLVAKRFPYFCVQYQELIDSLEISPGAARSMPHTKSNTQVLAKAQVSGHPSRQGIDSVPQVVEVACHHSNTQTNKPTKRDGRVDPLIFLLHNADKASADPPIGQTFMTTFYFQI